MSIEAMDELRIVQDIITTQEELCFKVFSWAVGFVTAFTIGLFHTSICIPSYAYVACGLIVVSGLFVVARHHWHTFSSAVVRSRQIEDEINSGKYSKVQINHVLQTDKSIGLFGDYKLWLPYLVLSAVVVAAGIFNEL